MTRVLGVLSRLWLVLVLVVVGPLSALATVADDSPWYQVDQEGNAQVHLYFAWSTTCPHCARAKPFVEGLQDEYPWLVVHSLPLDRMSDADLQTILDLADSIGETIRSVPSFLYCETMKVGYLSDETTGAELEEDLVTCRNTIQAELDDAANREPLPDDEEPIIVPILGPIDPATVSLPAFTVVIAALDAFNPCAFFVLLFLLSLLVHARSRARMATIGGTFVLISGVVYFAFMVAWLNVFLVFGALPAITVVAGLVAVAIATINIKDYFWYQQGPTLSISEEARPKLFSRMRALTQSTSFPLIMLGTVTLALAANAYELLCTAGFPLVFTRVLTLNELPIVTYYLYLVLYNVVYVIPLLAIVAVFVWTLGSRKLSERAGRSLKLLSGLMMLGLGLVLIFANSLLDNLLTAPLILLGALLVTAIVVAVDRSRHPREAHSR